MHKSVSNRHKIGLFLTTIVVGLCLILGSTLREAAGVVIIGLALTWAFGSSSRMLRYCIGGLGVLGFIAPLVVALTDHHNAVQLYDQSLDSFRSKLPQFAKEHLDLSAGIVDLSSSSAAPNAKPQIDMRTYQPAATAYGGRIAAQEWDASGKPIPTAATDNPLACVGTPVPPPPPGFVAMRVLAVPSVGNISLACTMSDKDIARALRAYPENNRAPSWYIEALDAGVSPDYIGQLTPPLDKPEAFNIKHTISDGAVIEFPSAILAILFFGSVIAEAKRFTRHSNKPVES
jgi:hypothetical protein